MKIATVSILSKIKEKAWSGHERSVRANKNILYSFLIKGMSIGCQFALVPLTLNYLDETKYGIWLTLASILGWFSFFNIGIGNGLRNKLSEALANNNLHLARIYVSTSYALVGSIFSVILILFFVVNPLLNWAKILNTPAELQLELSKMILFVFAFFCVRFILLLIGSILYAYQKSALNNLIGPLGSIFSLFVIYILTITTEGSLLWVAVTFSAIPVLVLLIFNIIFFAGKFRDIAPSTSYIDLRYSKDLLGLGIKFFIIQIASLVLYSSANIILIQLFGPEEVTVYNIGYKYFTIALMVNGIITATYWSSFTEAYVKKDFSWIKSAIRKLEYIAYALIVFIIISAVFADEAFYLWIGNSVTIPTTLIISMSLYSIISLIAAPQHIFLNGTGKIKLQLYSAVFSIIITIPLALLFCNIPALGPSGVILAMLGTSIPCTVLWRIQYFKIISGKAKGIWNE